MDEDPLSPNTRMYLDGFFDDMPGYSYRNLPNPTVTPQSLDDVLQNQELNPSRIIVSEVPSESITYTFADCDGKNSKTPRPDSPTSLFKSPSLPSSPAVNINDPIAPEAVLKDHALPSSTETALIKNSSRKGPNIKKKISRKNFDWISVPVPGLVWKELTVYVDSLQPANDNIKIVKDKLNRVNKLTLEVYSTFKCGGFRRYGCTYALKFVQRPNSEDCLVFEHGKHFHSEPDLQKVGIPQHVKPMLESGLQMCAKPGKIYREMSRQLPKDVYAAITPKQVSAAVVYMGETHGSVLKQNTIGYLYEWLEGHGLTVHSELHTVGVLPGWVAKGPVSIQDVSSDVHFVLTTKGLLRNFVDQANSSFGQLLALDGTYSLLDVGYPVLRCGTIDANHSYHDGAICVSRHEDEAAFKLMLTSIRDALFLFFHFVMRPLSSVPDKARAIYNAISDLFPHADDYAGVVIAICYFHNKQAIETNKSKFSSDDRRQAFEADVEKLHALTSTAVFQKAMDLFQYKWSRKEKQATEWYMAEWGNTLFHAGATPPGAPSANSTTKRSDSFFKDNVKLVNMWVQSTAMVERWKNFVLESTAMVERCE